MRPYDEAAHDILWVLDSNIAVAPGTLTRAIGILCDTPSNPIPPRRRIALVHHVPFAISSHVSFGAQVEEVFLNTNHAKMYIAINAVAVDSCVVGKSNLFRRSDLERLDGSLIRQQNHENIRHGRGLAAFGPHVPSCYFTGALYRVGDAQRYSSDERTILDGGPNSAVSSSALFHLGYDRPRRLCLACWAFTASGALAKLPGRMGGTRSACISYMGSWRCRE